MQARDRKSIAGLQYIGGAGAAPIVADGYLPETAGFMS